MTILVNKMRSKLEEGGGSEDVNIRNSTTGAGAKLRALRRQYKNRERRDSGSIQTGAYSYQQIGKESHPFHDSGGSPVSIEVRQRRPWEGGLLMLLN